MFFSSIRRNKENILYFIVTIFCLEYVRTHYNKLEGLARDRKWEGKVLKRKQGLLITAATAIYAAFVSLLFLNFSITLT
ncbi:hypothetical protein KKC91_11240 [bacterium]|nr:hypothetical protein [bacterium]